MEKQIFSSGNRLKLVFFSFVVAAILLAAVASFAQLPTAKIVGTVKDSSGASVPNASVRVTNVDTNITRTLTTDADGSLSGAGLSKTGTGIYTLVGTSAADVTAKLDSLIFTPEALRHLIAECGVSQIMMGTDYPFPWTSTSVDHILNTPCLSNADKQAILGGNASKLLGIPS